jgi:hypothetical protein
MDRKLISDVVSFNFVCMRKNKIIIIIFCTITPWMDLASIKLFSIIFLFFEKKTTRNVENYYN